MNEDDHRHESEVILHEKEVWMKTMRWSFFVIIVLLCSFCVQSLWAAEIDLRLGHSSAPLDDAIYHVTALKFKELVEKYSNGGLTVTIYPSMQLGTESEMVEHVKVGSLDLSIISLNQVSNHAPRLEALILPYMFENKESARKAIDTLWDDFNQNLMEKANMKLLTLQDHGYRQLMTTTPIMSMEDLKKAKIRIPPNPVMMRMFDAWGITPTPIAWGELFNAMQLKVVDGFECDVTVLISNRYNEVVTYITDIDYRLQISTLVMNVDSYNKLPAELQTVIDKAAAETMEYMRGQSDSLIQYCIDQSPTVKFLGPPEDLEEWRNKAKSIWPEFYELIGDGDAEVGKAVVESVVEAAK